MRAEDLETVRLIKHAPALTINIDPVRITLGDLDVPLPRDAQLRLAWASSAKRNRIAAGDIVDRSDLRRTLAGAVVLIGGSAPELGGLRDTPGDP